MELVYLWVDSYKNIEKQGFNFSPRFKCKYDEKENKLEIIDKEAIGKFYPKNFFGNNINVMAIVGENGSGKSSLIQELLTDEKFYCSINEENNGVSNKLWIYNKNDNQVRELHRDDLSFYNDMIVYSEDLNSELFDSKYNINSYLAKLNIFDNYKANNISISFLSHINTFNELSEFPFLPTNIELNLIETIYQNEFDELLGYRFMIEDDINDTQHPIVVDISEINKFSRRLQEELNKAINIYQRTRDIKDYMYIREFIYKLNKKDKDSLRIFREILEKNYFIGENFIEKLDSELYYQERELLFKEIILLLNQFQASDKQISLNLNNKELYKLLMNINRGFFDIKFFKIGENKEKVYFNSLSTGEQQILILFSKIFYILRKQFKDSNKKIFLFLDEPDSYLHPNWQKRLLFNLVKMFKKDSILNNKDFNIIITSHSPFILSDLPKENVIFLEKGKQVYPFEDNQQTFGANIHTLLSHGFFMKEGLMGEFAKGKIEEIKKFYELVQKLTTRIKNKEKTKELVKKAFKKRKNRFYNIQSIIGEPFLKTIMGNYLDELEQIFDNEVYKNNKKKEFLDQFSPEELQKCLDEKNAKA